MPTVRRSRTLRATPEEVWAVVGDAYHLPRWWPRVTRVEGVEGEAFTQVLTTAKGVPVRADFRVVESSAPSLRCWEQQVVNTPFERILVSSSVEVRIASAGQAAATVSLTLAQRMRGLGLLGGFMVRRAGRRQLDGALDGLEALVGEGGESIQPRRARPNRHTTPGKRAS